MSTKITSSAQFSDLLKSSRIVIADFFANWCGPCQQIAPIYEQLSSQMSRENLITFVKVDTDAQKAIASAYNVTSLPTFIFFRDGKAIDKVQGADPRKLQTMVKKLLTEVANIGDASGSGSGGLSWRGAELPRGYSDITSQIELQRCELLNVDPAVFNVKVLFDSAKPSALSGANDTAKDWIETDTDEQLLLFIPFMSNIKLHTLQITSLPPKEDDEVPMRPKTIKLFTNKPHNLGFEEAEDMSAIQHIELSESDWNAEGTANIPLRFVKFQNINSLVIFVVDADGENDSEKVRLDRVRLIGEAGEKREMGQLQKKIGDEAGD